MPYNPLATVLTQGARVLQSGEATGYSVTGGTITVLRDALQLRESSEKLTLGYSVSGADSPALPPRLYRLAVRTLPSQGENTGSIPVRATVEETPRCTYREIATLWMANPRGKEAPVNAPVATSCLSEVGRATEKLSSKFAPIV